ncbi:MAG: hypothetical protein FD134_1659 [Gallionellaceae bacterium]|nr:MAG: hypothetical protein FD134_1659 [Gallionellaceae bacterium]
MLPANLLNAIKALALDQKPLATATAAASPQASRFEPGQKFQGSVQDQIASGQFRVRVGDQAIQMQLPATVKSGDTIALQVVATQPRLVFSMSASNNPLSTPEQLSSASRLLSALSQQQPEKAVVRTAHKAPLWPMPQPPESKQLAGQLHEALSYSGLFYESHQAQWMQGARSITQLLQEPQNRLPAPPLAAGENPATQAPQRAPAQPQDGGTPAIPEHLQPLVQQQLNALETRQMVWHGNVWPGQTMQWEIHDHEQHAPSTETGEQRQWTTLISLNLPRLGTVSARLHFSGNGELSLALAADTGSTRMALGNASAQLLASLAGNGIPVASMQVMQHAPTQ